MRRNSSAVPFEPLDQFIQPPHGLHEGNNGRVAIGRRLNLGRSICNVVMTQPSVDIADDRAAMLRLHFLPVGRRAESLSRHTDAAPIIAVAEIAALSSCPRGELRQILRNFASAPTGNAVVRIVPEVYVVQPTTWGRRL